MLTAPAHTASASPVLDLATTITTASISMFRNDPDSAAEEEVEKAADGAVAAMMTVVGAGVVTNFALAMAKSAAAVTGAVLIGPSVKVLAATGAVNVLAEQKTDDEQDGLLWLQALCLVVGDGLRGRAGGRAASSLDLVKTDSPVDPPNHSAASVEAMPPIATANYRARPTLAQTAVAISRLRHPRRKTWSESNVADNVNTRLAAAYWPALGRVQGAQLTLQ